MGWKGYESKIHAGMVFKRMYCHKCGNKLKIKKISKVYKRGDPEFSPILGGTMMTIGMDRVQRSHFIYRCANCNTDTTYDEQCVIATRQKRAKRRILEDAPKCTE